MLDAEGFLNLVVPWAGQGFTTIHWQRPGVHELPGRSCRTLDEALQTVAKLKAAPYNIFFCLSKQRLNAGQRSRKNALLLGAVWIDSDIDPENPLKYASLPEAVASLLWFCDRFKIPRPSLLVGSGGGLHAYWLSDRPLPTEDWQIFANALKAAAQQYGLKFDAGVTSDASRVLRVPETINYKYDPPRPVQLLQGFCPATRHDFLAIFANLLPVSAVAAAAGSQGGQEAAIAVAPAFQQLDADVNLAEGIETPLLAFAPVKQACPWLREAHDTGGKDFDEPQWHQTIRVATYLENGHGLAHKFSDKHPEYSFQQTEEKWHRALRDRRDKDLGYPRCRTIQDAGSRHCGNCPHLALGKSPLNFGLKIVTDSQPAKDEQEIRELGGSRPEDLKLPEGYAVDWKGRICAHIRAKYVKKHAEPAQLLLLLLTQVRNPSLQYRDGKFGLNFSASTDKGGWHDVFIPSGNSQTWQTQLAEQFVLINYGDKKVPNHVIQLTSSWMDKLRQEQEAARDSNTLGWRYENSKRIGFIYGGQLHRVNGPSVPAINAGDDEFQKWYRPVGKREPWLQAAKLLTGRKQPELDCIISIGFAAPLMVFCGSVYGCILSVWGEPGTAKSTAQMVAAAIWGHHKQTRESLSSTPKSIQGRLGRTRNLPAYWDDVQDERHQERLFETMFIASEGAEGGRLNPDASYKERLEWQTLLMACSNASFVEFLSKKQKSTTAGMRRVFEFEFTKRETGGMINGLEASRTFHALEHNYGVIGMEYAQLLAAKHDQVGELLSSTMQAFESKVGAVTDENFWVAICATLLTGAKLARQLGAELNVAAMDTFLQRAFIKNRETRKKEGTEGGSYDNTEFGLADFLNFHLGQGNVMYTNILFKHKHIVVHELRPPLKGHTLTVQIARDERKIIISKRALKEYLHKTGIHTRQILDGLEKYFRAREIKVTLGAGTVYAQAQEPCVEIMVPIGQPLLEDILTAQGEPK